MTRDKAVRFRGRIEIEIQVAAGQNEREPFPGYDIGTRAHT